MTSRNTWNYRVMEFESPDGYKWRSFHEVHYENDVPVLYTENPTGLQWDVNEDGTDGSLIILDRLREALDKPVLTQRDFDHDPKSDPLLSNQTDQ